MNLDLDKIKAEEPNSKGDSISKKEEIFFFKEKQRDDNAKGHQHKLFVMSLYIIFFIGLSLIFIRSLMLVLPENYRWLTETQIQSMDKLLFSGSLGTIFGKYSSNLFKFNNSPKNK